MFKYYVTMFWYLNMNHCSTYILVIYIFMLGFMFKCYVTTFQCLNMNRGSIYILILFSCFILTILVDNHNCSKILIKCFDLKTCV
jgi:hypothetical protein